jgi:hypothetical protein
MTETEPKAQAIHIRPPRPADQAYIASTWVSSLGLSDNPKGSSARGHIVDSLLDKAGVKVLVAVDGENHARIMGWICWSPMPSVNVVHYVYVRNQLRKQGIGTLLAHAADLVGGKPVVYTCEGPAERWLLERHTATLMSAEEFLR